MAGMQSFDISTGCDLQEVDNAVNQASKELQNRYDFRGLSFEIAFDRQAEKLTLSAPDEYKLDAIWQVLQAKMVRRQVPVKNLHRQDITQSGVGSAKRQEIQLQQGIPTDTAKQIVKFIKELKLKKTQASIQEEQVRVTSPSRDDLQKMMSLLKENEYGVELEFGNFRG